MKRSSYEIKRAILMHVKEEPLSYAALERKVNTGHNTIKNSCLELEKFGQVKIKRIDEHPANGRKSFSVSITRQGIETIEKEKV